MKTMKLLFHMRKPSLLFLLMMLSSFTFGETMIGEMLYEGNEWFYMGYYTKVKARTDIFNLQGQRISSLQKGLNIVNGRKVVIK